MLLMRSKNVIDEVENNVIDEVENVLWKCLSAKCSLLAKKKMVNFQLFLPFQTTNINLKKKKNTKKTTTTKKQLISLSYLEKLTS